MSCRVDDRKVAWYRTELCGIGASQSCDWMVTVDAISLDHKYLASESMYKLLLMMVGLGLILDCHRDIFDDERIFVYE